MTATAKRTTKKRLRSLATAQTPQPEQPADADGRFGAGVLKSVSVITIGEALGHGMWVDDVFLNQVQAALSAADGVKSRFTHPGLCADGLAKGLGLAVGGVIDGESVRSDLHFYSSATHSPDGNLVHYVRKRAEEDPKNFGLSIVFTPDELAEQEFMLANGGQWVTYDDGWGTFRVIEGFASPDPRNVDNLPHCRLTELSAVDVVDEPAANPSGMFHRERGLSAVNNAESFLDYAFGLTERLPEGESFGVDPERAREFVSSYAARRGLSLPTKKGDSMATKSKAGKLAEGDQIPPATEAADPPQGAITCPECGHQFLPGEDSPTPPPMSETPQTPAEYAAAHKKWVEAFGEVNGTKWFLSGMKFSDAQQQHFIATLAAKDAEIASLKSQLDEANAKLAAIANSGATPLNATPAAQGTDPQPSGGKKSLSDVIKPAGKA